MGDVAPLLEVEATAEHEREGETGRTGVDVHRGAAGEVDESLAEPGLHPVREPAAVLERAVELSRPKLNTQLATGK